MTPLLESQETYDYVEHFNQNIPSKEELREGTISQVHEFQQWSHETFGDWEAIVWGVPLCLYILGYQLLQHEFSKKMGVGTSIALGILWPLTLTFLGLRKLQRGIFNLIRRPVKIYGIHAEWDDLDPDIREIDRSEAVQIGTGGAIKEYATKEEHLSLVSRVTQLEGQRPIPGIIDECESGKGPKVYRGYQGDYLEVNGKYALKKDGKWSGIYTSDNYWPESLYEIMPSNFAYRLLKDARQNGLFLDSVTQSNPDQYEPFKPECDLIIDDEQKFILIPRTYCELVSLNPHEKRQLNLCTLHCSLFYQFSKTRQMHADMPHTFIPAQILTKDGLATAPVLTFLNYTIIFEDGDYTVVCYGANSNILDKTYKNHVNVIMADA